ncbi:hypothetical protein [Vogesella indigofera]|uniref:hypothetical protein n=1 Tax=Vogesella indigofera TaxID=45465 RepID=UPI00234F8C46|nr:hypothetical protein [Vogesella indigofera]MDC7701655.1 hypothetical protein [Vogesella indigofera]
MNKPIETIFTTRTTVTIVLPLGKNTHILRPEQVILKIGPLSHDLGAFCYSLRSSKARKPGQPREVVIGSFLKQRPKEILQLIKALSRLVEDDGKRLTTVLNYANQLRSFLDWADSIGLHDCLSGGDATRNAYRAWVAETRERYLRQEFGERVHNDRLDFICSLLEASTGLDALSRGVGKVKNRWNLDGGTEPLVPRDFAHGVALNQALFDGLCDLVLEPRAFPYKLELPAALGWAENHLWLFPNNRWCLPPHQWGAKREKSGNYTCWAYDYANGGLATIDEIQHRYAKFSPSYQRATARAAINRAQARINAANADPLDRYRIMLGIIASKAFLFLFLCNTAANESVAREIETNGEVDASTSNQQFRSIKFRASSKVVTLTIPATFMPTLRRFMELRRYLLQGRDFPYLFFTLGVRNENPPKQIGYRPLVTLIESQLRAVDSQFPHMNIRKLRSSVADWYQRHHDMSITAKVLQNTEQTAQKCYDAGSDTDHREELSLFLTSVSESARRQRIIPVKAVEADAPLLEEGGHCDRFGHPEALADNAPVKPDCKDSQGCLFCKHRVLVACEEDARKVASAAFVMEQMILGPLHETALRPLIAKCDEDLEKIANFRNCRAMVEQVCKEVFESGNLTPFFADKYQFFLELGVII